MQQALSAVSSLNTAFHAIEKAEEEEEDDDQRVEEECFDDDRTLTEEEVEDEECPVEDEKFDESDSGEDSDEEEEEGEKEQDIAVENEDGGSTVSMAEIDSCLRAHMESHLSGTWDKWNVVQFVFDDIANCTTLDEQQKRRLLEEVNETFEKETQRMHCNK